MNLQAVRVLFFKDLFLSRRQLFAYFVAGMASAALMSVNHSTVSFIGFLLVATVAIAAGIHLIGTLLLSESNDQTRLFVMSLPVSLLDYSISKIAVIMTTYLLPWSAMFACFAISAFVLPWAHQGSVAPITAIFFFFLASFTVQLVTAVITESAGWTICVMVAGNILLNVFLMKLFAQEEVVAVNKSDILTWPPIVLQIIAGEVLIVVFALCISFLMQTRKRDLV